MKNSMLPIPLLLLLGGCGILSEKFENLADKLSVPSKRLGKKQGYTMHLILAPKGQKDGRFSGKASNGRTFKTVVKNGIYDHYFDVYNADGSLHSHTPLKNGIAQGWATIHTKQGKMRVLYQKGTSVRRVFYDKKGRKVKELHP